MWNNLTSVMLKSYSKHKTSFMVRALYKYKIHESVIAIVNWMSLLHISTDTIISQKIAVLLTYTLN